MIMGQRGRWALTNLQSTFSAPFSLYIFKLFETGFLITQAALSSVCSQG